MQCRLRNYLNLFGSVLLLVGFVEGVRAQDAPVTPSAIDGTVKAPLSATAPKRAAVQSPKKNTRNPPAIPTEDQVLFQYLISEIAGQRGNSLLAIRSMIGLAQSTHDGRIARRAAELAFQARLLTEARLAILTWLQIEPDAPAARQGLALLLGTNSAADLTTQTNPPPTLASALATIGEWMSDARFAPVILVELPVLLARYEEREEVFIGVRKLVQRVAAKPEAHFAVASAALLANRPKEALTAIDDALKLRPVWSRAVLLKAQLLRNAALDADGVASANRYLEGFLREHPSVADVRIAYARSLVAEKAFLSAREQFRLAAKLLPDDVELIYALGLISQQIEDFSDAETQYKRAIELKPRDPSAIYFNLAAVAEGTANADGALGWYRQIVSGDYFVPAQLKSAALLSKRGGLQAGRDFLRRARDADGVAPEQRNQLFLAEVQLLRDAKAYAEAYALLTTLMAEQPTAHDFVYDRAMVAEKLGRLDDMERDLRRVMVLKPDHAHAFNALGYTFVERGVRLDEAETLITAALAITPNDAFIQDSLGWLRFKQGKLDEALEVLQRAYALRADPEIAAHLGEVLWARGDREAATKLLRVALIESPNNESLVAAIKRFLP